MRLSVGGDVQFSRIPAVVNTSPGSRRNMPPVGVFLAAPAANRRFQTPLQLADQRQTPPPLIQRATDLLLLPSYVQVSSTRRQRMNIQANNNNSYVGGTALQTEPAAAVAAMNSDEMSYLHRQMMLDNVAVRCSTEQGSGGGGDDDELPTGQSFHRLRKHAIMQSKIRTRSVGKEVPVVTQQSTTAAKMKQKDILTKIYSNDQSLLVHHFDAASFMKVKSSRIKNNPLPSATTQQQQHVLSRNSAARDITPQRIASITPLRPANNNGSLAMSRRVLGEGLRINEDMTQPPPHRRSGSMTPFSRRSDSTHQPRQQEIGQVASVQFELLLNKRGDNINHHFPSRSTKSSNHMKQNFQEIPHVHHAPVPHPPPLQERPEISSKSRQVEGTNYQHQRSVSQSSATKQQHLLDDQSQSRRLSALRCRRKILISDTSMQQTYMQDSTASSVKGSLHSASSMVSSVKHRSKTPLNNSQKQQSSQQHNLSLPPFDKASRSGGGGGGAVEQKQLAGIPKEAVATLRHQQSDEKKVTVEQLHMQASAMKAIEDSQITIGMDARVEYEMSDEEWKSFGDRFPSDFKKLKLLGRGGFAMVWLGVNEKNKQLYAIKQVLSTNAHQTHIKEIWFADQFYDEGMPRLDLSYPRGLKNIIRLAGYSMEKVDTWLFYELGGVSLGNNLYEIMADKDTPENDRIFRIVYKDLYKEMRVNPGIMKQLICELAHGINLISSQGIVHSDLKTENILVKANAEKISGRFRRLEDVRLADYGSAFTFGDLKGFTMATPEYMAPEILNYILYVNKLKYDENLYNLLQDDYTRPFVIDIWSLGCVALELINGIPLWMSLQTKLTDFRGKEIVKTGLFAVKNRVFDEIIAKQCEIVKNIDAVIDEKNYPGIAIDPPLRKAIKGMLQINPALRLSPLEVIQILQPQTKQP